MRLPIVFIFLIAFDVARADVVELEAVPPLGADHISIFSEVGFDWKSCAEDNRPAPVNGNGVKPCEAIAWPKRGERMKVIVPDKVPVLINGNRHEFVFVEYRNPSKIIKNGYVNLENTRLYHDPNKKTEADDQCKDCEKSDKIPLQNIVPKNPEFRKKEVNAALEKNKSTVPNPKMAGLKLPSHFNNRCKDFINDDGQLGPWGQLAVTSMAKVDQPFKAANGGKSCFYEDLDVSSVCPNFKKMTKDQKNLFWAWSLAAIAQQESSCNPKALAEGVNGKASGLFQHEYSVYWRNKAGRDVTFCKTKEKYDTTEFQFQMECTAAIFRDVHCSEDRPLNSPNGYWHELRRKQDGTDRKIGRDIKRFPLCGSK